MKAKLNLSIDNTLLENIKDYASNKRTSVSALVENYIKKITAPVKRNNILNMVEKLPKPKIDTKSNLKELYYQDQSKKYGL